MTHNKNHLIRDLQALNTKHKKLVTNFVHYNDDQLNYRRAEGRWTLLENIEHLVRYAEFYVPVIEKAIANASKSDTKLFKSGWLGNMFATSMLPGKNMKTIGTFKSKNPIGEPISKKQLDTLSHYLIRLESVLSQCYEANLNTKTATTIPLTRIRLGDTLRVVVYHHERHMEQIKNIGLQNR